jgi:D-glycero-alpha-D-manno-heptose 1-phosphate guanylyltransferase
MVTKEAIVLAGGLGLRLKGLLPDIPKCMAPVQGRPFLTYVLDYLERQTIAKVILSVGYRKEQIISFFGNNYKTLEIRYSEENEPLGTGGALKSALALCSENEVFVLNGDTYFIPDLNELEKQHSENNADITIAVIQKLDTCRYGLIVTDRADRIIEFREKEPTSGKGWINGGVYLIKKKIVETISDNKFSLENDVFKAKAASLHIHAYRTDAFFLDIGIPEDYNLAQTLLVENI